MKTARSLAPQESPTKEARSPARILPFVPSRPRLVIEPDTLRTKRLSAALSRKQLAVLSGVSAKRIEKIELGSNIGVRPETARALASALECPVSDLATVRQADTD